MNVTLRVNGQEHRLGIEAQHTLLDVLRDQLKLLSVREGCGIGICGACTILIDGRPMSGCHTLAALAEGREIVTLEGLGTGEQLDVVQEAFLARVGFQCSYCTPAMVLSAKALLAENPDPTPDEIAHYLAGNLCRCGSYPRIVEAVRLAAEWRRGGRTGLQSS